ncbi:SDR family oxidoreductase [Candidatus Marifrigoribacter sp. Uisw_064]|jgi:short-subunit dehydrogenase|uniref:SDR family NAD(P)-dependent oxidoreductase n=1 Tax=Candidatus Marifrigoribacter sp. Uisw_064 TaxID=3230970 RepID=UPI003D39EC18
MNNKTALVTGAASGLGYEFAVLLAKDSYNLILIDIDSENLEGTKKELESLYQTQVTILVKDLSTAEIANEIYNEIQDKSIDVLINNAGFGLFGTFSKTNWQRESAMLHLHIMTTTHLTKLLLNGMVERGKGRILNISSLAAFQPGPLMAIYYASKAYILSFSEAIANELKGTGVTVTVLCPGQTKTSFQQVVSKQNCDNKISFNMACPVQVAKYGYNAMMQGKTVVVPGFFNKFLSKLPRLMPRKTSASIVRKIQEKNREGSLN